MIIIGLLVFNIILNIIIIYFLIKLNKKEFVINNIYNNIEEENATEELEDTIDPVNINTNRNIMDFTSKIPVYKFLFKK